MDVYGLAFDNFFDSALSCEPFIAFGVILDHFYQLVGGDEVVQDDNVFGDVDDFFLGVVHPGDYFF